MSEPPTVLLDGSAVPDGFSGARTRLRGLLGAYARLAVAPRLVVVAARGTRLLDGIALGPIEIVEREPPGGPLRRALLGPWLRSGRGLPRDILRDVKLWHGETIPPLAPAGIPALLTLHDLRWHEARAVTGAPWSKWLLRHVAARAWLPRLAGRLAGVVAVSAPAAARIARTLALPMERVHVVQNACEEGLRPRLPVDAERGLLDRLGIAGRPFLLAVGHLEPRKGLDLAVAVLARLPPQLRLVLVGDGVARGALARQARELGVAERVCFAGRLEEPAVQSLYLHAEALLFPSRCEGFGFPVHEALAAGCPVLASDLDVFAAIDSPLLRRLPRELERWMAALAGAGSGVGPDPRQNRAAGRAGSWTASAQQLARVYAAILSQHGHP